jgi:hypothetical protein
MKAMRIERLDPENEPDSEPVVWDADRARATSRTTTESR